MILYTTHVKYQLPTGPMHPSSHDLPWLSKPLIPLIYSTTDCYKLRAPPAPSQTLCNTRVTLALHSRYHCTTLGTYVAFKHIRLLLTASV